MNPIIQFIKDTHWLRYRRFKLFECSFANSLVAHGVDVAPLLWDAERNHILNSYSDDVIIVGSENLEAINIVICAMQLQNVDTILYYGRNVDMIFPAEDLFPNKGKGWVYEELASFENGKKLYRILCQANRKLVAARIKWSDNRESGWGKVVKIPGKGRGKRPTYELEWSGGGYCTFDSLDQIVEHKILGSLRQIYTPPENYKDGRVEDPYHGMPGSDKPMGDYGWLAPDAVFYPCGSRGHEAMMAFCFGLGAQQAGKQGWIKCYGRFWSKERDWHVGRDEDDVITPEQAKVLQDHGYTVDDYQIQRTVEGLSKEEQDALQSR